jgi:hypothetical protein
MTPQMLHPPAKSSKDNPDHISANVACNNNCHICKQPGHWSAKCPYRKKPVLTCTTYTNQNGNPNPYNASAYQPYCPIFSPTVHHTPILTFPTLPHISCQMHNLPLPNHTCHALYRTPVNLHNYPPVLMTLTTPITPTNLLKSPLK